MENSTRMESNEDRLQDNMETSYISCDEYSFQELPEPVQLYIFSLLDPTSLLRAAQVCQQWNKLGTDNILWKRKLECDVTKWNVIGHTFNPHLLKSSSDPDYKQIYITCSPLMRRSKLSLLGKITRALQYMVFRKVPKLAMFGPGLETGGTRLVVNLLQDYTNTFKFISMFPGRFEGIGSGITLNLNSCSLEFNLITLYTATQNERENRSAGERALQNRLFVQQNIGNNNQSKLQKAIKDLCRTLDGLIYVVHASCPQDELALGLPELLALSNEVLIPTHVPLLVLSCSTVDGHSRPSIELVKELQLLKLNRPWQVHTCIVDGMLGMEDAFKWIVEASRGH